MKPGARTQKRQPWLAAGVVAWGVAVAVGFAILFSYKTSPGAAADPPASWPSDTKITREPGVATLLLFAHPRCPCTRASLTELAQVMSRVGGGVRAHVLLVEPEGVAEDWDATDLRTSAQSIPGVSVERDHGGREAQRFGSLTSGQVLVYDTAGRLAFSGGITGIRGHPGDNAGRQRVVALLTDGVTDSDHSLVFGCSLQDPR